MFTHSQPDNASSTNSEDRSREEIHSPRALLWQLKQDNPEATEEELLTIFRTRILAEPDLITAVIDYYFGKITRPWSAKRTKHRPDPEKARKQQERQQRIESTVREKIVANAKKMVLMDLLLPHGKTLSQSTGKECRKLGPKVGKWLSKIGTKVPARKKVGDALSEVEVRSIWQA